MMIERRGLVEEPSGECLSLLLTVFTLETWQKNVAKCKFVSFVEVE
jgi:hypothetical protein